jgi:hypothetical protein
MKAWKENDRVSFNFHNAHEINNLMDWSSEETIKRRLRERLANTKVLVVLIGNNTRNLYKYVRWEIEYAVENDIPIIGVNLNGRRNQDSLCPPIMRDELAIYVPFGQKVIDMALNDWPASHSRYKREGKSGAYFYTDRTYENL